jgi:hypothetical protein
MQIGTINGRDIAAGLLGVELVNVETPTDGEERIFRNAADGLLYTIDSVRTLTLIGGGLNQSGSLIGSAISSQVINAGNLANTSVFFALFSRNSLGGTATYQQVAITMPKAGSISRLYVNLFIVYTTVPNVGNIILLINKNGVDTGLKITVPFNAVIPALPNGLLVSDLVDIVNYVQGDVFSIHIANTTDAQVTLQANTSMLNL